MTRSRENYNLATVLTIMFSQRGPHFSKNFPASFGLILLLTLSAANFLFNPSVFASEEMSVVRLQVEQDTIEKLLREGEILVIKENQQGGRFKFITAGVLINAAPDQVWKTITDYNHYQEFVPECEKVSVAPGDARHTLFITFSVAFKFSVLKYHLNYTLREVYQKDKWRIDWTRKEGDLAEAIGAWELIPLEGGKKTAVFYSSYSDLRSIGYLVENLLKEQPVMELAIASTSAILMARAVKARVEGKELK